MRVSKNFLNTYANRGMDLENDINIFEELEKYEENESRR